MSLHTSNLLASFLMCSLHWYPKQTLPGDWLLLLVVVDVVGVVIAGVATEDKNEESVQKLANLPVLKQYFMPGWSSLSEVVQYEIWWRPWPCSLISPTFHRHSCHNTAESEPSLDPLQSVCNEHLPLPFFYLFLFPISFMSLCEQCKVAINLTLK